VDVSTNRQAAQEMYMRTGQLAVPVIADDQEAIVGFDVQRLQRMAARHRQGPSLGLKVADAKDLPGGGVRVGGVKPGGPGERAGMQEGDLLVELSGAPIGSVDDLVRVSKNWQPGRLTSLVVVREGERRTLFLR
jgi:S1-C subfamily serine protease